MVDERDPRGIRGRTSDTAPALFDPKPVVSDVENGGFHSMNCLLDMQEVTGSSPVPPTMFSPQNSPHMHNHAGVPRRKAEKRTEDLDAADFLRFPSREPE